MTMSMPLLLLQNRRSPHAHDARLGIRKGVRVAGVQTRVHQPEEEQEAQDRTERYADYRAYIGTVGLAVSRGNGGGAGLPGSEEGAAYGGEGAGCCEGGRAVV